jgi:capsular polysaccharide biosynthesis protein
LEYQVDLCETILSNENDPHAHRWLLDTDLVLSRVRDIKQRLALRHSWSVPAKGEPVTMPVVNRDTYPQAGHRVNMTPVTTLKSPSFRRQHPHIFNEELIEAKTRASMEDEWRRDLVDERIIEIFHLEGVYVIDESLILDNHLRVIANASDAYTDAEIDRALEAVQRDEEARTLPHIVKPTIVAKRRAAHHYSRYLMEMLPMACIAGRAFDSSGALYLVHRVPPPSQDVVFRSFRLLGISLERLVVQEFGQPMFFEHLLIAQGLTEHGKYMSPLSVIAAEQMAKKTFDIATTMPGRRYDKVFVRRMPGCQPGGALLNEAEVAARLSSRGFYVTEAGSLTLEQQIMTFRGARTVVGVSGAGMTNIAFCERGTNVTVLCPAMSPEVFFWFIATHKGLGYSEIRGAQPSYDTPNSQEGGFVLSERDIQYLESL